MGRAANVRSVDALRSAKFGLVEFRDIVRVALSEAHAEVHRTLWWLQNDQTTFWQHEVRRRTEQVNQAKSELYRAKLAAADDRASCIEQRKMLQRAETRLAEAELKRRRVREWVRMLDREVMLFKGQLQPMSRIVDVDLPRGAARLDHMIDRLEAYLKIEAPRSEPSPVAPPRERVDPGAGGTDTDRER